ncbi:hypothetical protein H632_c2040p0, partial [Helicosporidium sp. ATCC 50920]
ASALLREEGERVAQELVGAKLRLAESEEQLVKLRRQLVKAQEKSMSFASKLTRLETKFYAKMKSTLRDVAPSKAKKDAKGAGVAGLGPVQNVLGRFGS